jgi:hypothetical protein
MAGRKPLWVRLLEMIALYLLVGGLGLLLERRAGQISPKAGSSMPLLLRCF